MNTVDVQIKTAYEVENMTPAEIAENEGFSEIAVKAKLMQVSSKYRKACGQESPEEDDLNFSNDQLKDANQIIYETMLGATLPDGSVDHRTRLKAAEYIRDDKKGRKEVVKQIAGQQQFNIFAFNDSLQKARVNAEMMRKAIEA